jgi:hypothetical protein
MNQFVQKFSSVVKGVLTGFDRIVFKGSVLPLVYEEGARGFLRGLGILNKDYKQWMVAQSAKIVEDATAYAEAHCAQEGILWIPSSATRKEALAKERQQEEGIASGPVGVWSAVESCISYKARYCAQSGFPQIKSDWTKCKHLYFYFDHEDYGFMNVRLQTWFPYNIQVALNGREWLRRGLESHGCDFVAKGNKFLHIDDFALAQSLLEKQLDTRWTRTLDSFLPDVFPAMRSILGPHLSYYWTLWQSEWATDLVFPTPGHLAGMSDSLLRHAFMTGTAPRVLRYLDRPLTKAGLPYANMNNEVTSRLLDFADGVRVRHWVDHNSVKVYNERNVLRIETTVNQPGMFKVHRHAQGEPESAPKRRLPLRKGVADIVLRAQVSQEVNDRFMDQLATCSDETPVRDVIDAVCAPGKNHGRRFRALDVTGKDRALLQAIADPLFAISGITNRALREKLAGQPGYDGRTQKQLCAKVSRQLRLLRDHGLIRKMPRQNKYQLTAKGRQLTTTLSALLVASTQQLMETAA